MVLGRENVTKVNDVKGEELGILMRYVHVYSCFSKLTDLYDISNGLFMLENVAMIAALGLWYGKLTR